MKFITALFLLIALTAFGAVPSYDKFIGAGGIVITKNPPNGTIIIDGSGVVATGTNSSIRVSTNSPATTPVTAAATNLTFLSGNNTVAKGTNVGATAEITYGMESNLTFYSSLGPLVLGTWDGRFGFSNAAFGSMSLWIEEPDTGNEWSFAGQVSVSNIVLTTIPGTGTNVGISAGGTLFRTTTPSATDTNIGVGQTIYLDKTFGVDATASRTNLLRPFQTASNAVAAMLSGDTLVVRGGSYPVNPKADAAGEAVNWNHQAGLAFTNLSNIRIVGEPGSVWYMSSWRSNNLKFSCPMLHLERCTNVVIEGMTFIGLRTNEVVLGQGGIMMNHCSEVIFRDCTLSNWQVHGISWPTDLGSYNINSNIRFYNNTFANIGGTNHVTLVMDGCAIAVGGSNIEVVGNRFYNNLRDIEVCCDEDTRKFHILGNVSEGCYFEHIMITGTNSSEVIIANNIVKNYANVILPGASADGSCWIKTYAGSNILVQGNIVSGFANGIVSEPVVGTKTVDWRIIDNTFVDFSLFPIVMPSVNRNMVGFNAIYERNEVSRNRFMNCASAAVILSGNNSAVNDNTFIDCNLGGYGQGNICIGWPTAGVATNSVNISIVGNKLISSAANAGPGIIIYGMSSSNTVHGNEIDRKYASAITDLGVGTRTRPVNLVAAGSLLRSDTNGNERAVVFGSGVAWDGSTGTLTGTGGGGGGTVSAGQSVSVVTNGSDYEVAVGLKDLLISGTNRVAFSNGIAFALSPDGITNNALYFVSTNGTHPALVWETSSDTSFHGVGIQPHPTFATVLDIMTTYTGAALGTLRMRSIYLTNEAAIGKVWTATATDGSGAWSNAPAGIGDVTTAQLNTASNAVVTYANGVTNSSIVRQTQLTTMSNAVVTLSSNNVRVAAGTGISVASSGSAGVQTFTVTATGSGGATTNQVLTNLIGTVASTVTNVVSLSTSNATSRPLTNSFTAGVLTLRGIEGGTNVTLTQNGSNIVISAGGGGGISGIVAGNSNQIPYLDHTGTNYTYGAGSLSSLTNAGFGFRPTGPNNGYGGLLVFANDPMALLTIGHPNPASDFGGPATALVVSNRYNGVVKQELIKIDAVDIGSGSDPTSTLTTWRNWAGTTPTVVAEVRKDGLITSAAGFQSSPIPGSSIAAFSLFETNHAKAITISAPATLSSNINILLPTGISNGYMRVTSVNDSNFNVTFDTPGTSYTPLLVAGTGSALTNFTFLATQPEVIINGFTNVSITGVMGYDPARVDYWTLTITNGGGTDRPLIFSQQTNAWRFSGTYGTNAPSNLTNLTALHISARSHGTNTRVGYTYFPWP